MSDPATIQAAVEAAEQWLALNDAGSFDQSWEEAATYFKGAVNSEQWDAMMTGARAPLGDLLSRELDSTQYATELPGAPDGQYVVLQFKTSFSNKQHSIETVTPMLEDDRGWRVSGYFIK